MALLENFGSSKRGSATEIRRPRAVITITNRKAGDGRFQRRENVVSVDICRRGLRPIYHRFLREFHYRPFLW